MRWKCGSPILKNASICQDAFMAEYGQRLSHGESHGAGANSQNLGLHGSFSGAGTPLGNPSNPCQQASCMLGKAPVCPCRLDKR